MSSDDEDRYPTIQHTKQRDLVEDDDDDVDMDDDEQYDEDAGDNNGDVMDGDDDDEEGDQRITAWGTQKKRFYREGDEDESEEAEEDEEEEAKLIEKLQQEQLSHENFFDVFGDQAMTSKQKERGADFEEEEEEFPSFTLKAKFRSMEDLAESDKIALIQKESPELLNIIQEFKASLKELKYKFLPLISYLREKKTTMKEGQRYIEIKFNLLTSYCINLSFYILLNSQGKSVKDHPVIKKLISVKTSLARLKPLDKKLQGEINQILKSIEQENELKPKKGKASKGAAKGQAQGAVQNAKKSDKNLFGDANNGKKAAKNAENNKGKAALKSALKAEVPSGKSQKELLGKRGIADLNKKSVKFADEDIDDEIEDDDDMEGLGDDIDDDFGGEGFGDEDDGEDDFYKKIKNMKKVKRDTIGKEKAEKKKEQFKENPRHYVGEESSRTVTRKIMKNKGLTRHRGKTSGNARIKHKNRFEKAQHKLKSKGIVVREKGDYYTGEKHISAGKIRSTKY